MNYPRDIKAFYMWVNDDVRTVGTMDVPDGVLEGMLVVGCLP